MTTPPQTTRILADARRGDRAARSRLLCRVYEELHAIAELQMRRERRNHTLQPTALVHEAYLRLVGDNHVDCKDKTHFLAIASEVMRRVLVDHARRRAAAKRGGGARGIRLADDLAPSEQPELDFLALDAALDELGSLKDRHRLVVQMRCFGGLGTEQIADVLGVSPTTVKEDWWAARAWLRERLDRP